MTHSVIALVPAGIVITLLASAPAMACSPTPYDPTHVRMIERDVAGAMVRAATFVEIVEVERVEPLDIRPMLEAELAAALASEGAIHPLTDQRREALGQLVLGWPGNEYDDPAPEPARITYKVRERLKGDGPERFPLTGLTQADPKGRSELRAWAEEDRRRSRVRARNVWGSRTPKELEVGSIVANDCNSPLIGDLGARYLVFRGADGRLLGPSVRFRSTNRREFFEFSGSVYEEIIADDDPWPARVRRAAKRQALGR